MLCIHVSVVIELIKTPVKTSTLLHSERPKLYAILAFSSAVGLKIIVSLAYLVSLCHILFCLALPLIQFRKCCCTTPGICFAADLEREREIFKNGE